MTDNRDTGRDENGSAMLGSIVDRYEATKAAARAVVSARDEDGPAKHELMLATLVVLLDSVCDVPVLLRALRAARLRAANLTAAGRATLAADRDGEADALYYLRDELDHDHADGPDADPAGPVVW